MKKIYLISVGILALSLFFTSKMYQSERGERIRLEQNQSTLMSDVIFYRTKDSLSAASIQRLTLNVGELERNRQELSDIVRGLEIKLKRLQSASATSTSMYYDVTAPVKDSVVYRSFTVMDTLSCIDFRNPWMNVSGCLSDGVFSGHVACADTLHTIVHRVPRKFLFIRWGTKAVRQEVVSRNPYTSITYTEYIELKKQRRTRRE